MLKIKKLTVKYGTDVQAAKDVDLEIRKGEIVGLVGESGSGKSTVALSILKLIGYPGQVKSGEILWNERDILKMGNEELRKLRGGGIAMIFQDPFSSLNPVFTIGDQIEEAVKLHGGDDAVTLLDAVQMPDPESTAKKFPHELSGGMRQRAMIAMALAGRPKLLIADEPTTALDVTIQAGILKLLKELQAKLGMSVLIITHNLALVYGFCDRVCIMKEGRIVERGSVEDIFRNPKEPYTRELIDAIPRPRWK